MQRWVAKMLALFGTFILPLICTLLPFKVSDCIADKGERGKRVLSYLMCFGGGIFFGTYILHMGPEVQLLLKESYLDKYGIVYPVAELLVGIGFFIVLFAEKLVLRWHKRRLRQRRKSCRHSLVSEMQVLKTEEAKAFMPSSGVELCNECAEGKPCSGYDDHEIRHKDADLECARVSMKHSESSTYPTKMNMGQLPTIEIEDLSGCATAITSPTEAKCPMSGTGECCTDQRGKHLGLSQKEKHIIVSMKVEDDGLKSAENDNDKRKSTDVSGGHHHATRSLILILALSLHRIFEGMSVGLQKNVVDVFSLFGAVMCHEMVIGFSLGLQFVRSGFGLRRLLVTTFVCSSIMPVGVLIGLVMTEVESDSDSMNIANGFLQAIAMGTFIYVTFFEILQEEIDPEDTNVWKVVFIFLGFSLMAVLTMIPEGQLATSEEKLLNTTELPLLMNIVTSTSP